MHLQNALPLFFKPHPSLTKSAPMSASYRLCRLTCLPALTQTFILPSACAECRLPSQAGHTQRCCPWHCSRWCCSCLQTWYTFSSVLGQLLAVCSSKTLCCSYNTHVLASLPFWVCKSAGQALQTGGCVADAALIHNMIVGTPPSP